MWQGQAYHILKQDFKHFRVHSRLPDGEEQYEELSFTQVGHMIGFKFLSAGLFIGWFKKAGAADMGLKVGMKLVKIGDESCSASTLSETREIYKRLGGARGRLTFIAMKDLEVTPD